MMIGQETGSKGGATERVGVATQNLSPYRLNDF